MHRLLSRIRTIIIHTFHSQLVKNYRNGRAEALSWAFLCIWLLGDVSNFVGCLLTNRLAFQIYLATYFLVMDAALLVQWLYYYYTAKLEPPLTNDEERLLLRPASTILFSHEDGLIVEDDAERQDADSTHEACTDNGDLADDGGMDSVAVVNSSAGGARYNVARML